METRKKKSGKASPADKLAFATVVTRFKVHTFKNSKQMQVVRDYLLAEFDAAIAARKSQEAVAKLLSKKVKGTRDEIQGEICGRWAEAKLKANDVVKLRGYVGRFLVVKVEAEGLMVCKVLDDNRTVDPMRPGVVAQPYNNVQKILINENWLDVYMLASGE